MVQSLMDSLTFDFRPVPPFRLDLTAWALRRRVRNIIDRWDRTTYRRVLVAGDVPVEASVTQVGPSDHPGLAVRITGPKLTAEMRAQIKHLLSRALGLETNLQPFYALASRDRRLAPLVEQFRGLKPPRFPSVFEAFVNAIACQQLSLTVGIELLNRLAMRCGPMISSAGAEQLAFPGAEDLLRVKPPTFRHLGFSYSKATSLLSLARETREGQFQPEQLQDLDNESAVQESLKLRGVGRWTAEYALLRGLGRLDTFPGDDVGARNRLALWLGRDGPLDYDAVKRAVKRWHPYAGLVYFHLLLAGLTESGEMPPDRVDQAS
jgi:DNA-3-methyladenine glycosylase II